MTIYDLTGGVKLGTARGQELSIPGSKGPLENPHFFGGTGFTHRGVAWHIATNGVLAWWAVQEVRATEHQNPRRRFETYKVKTIYKGLA